MKKLDQCFCSYTAPYLCYVCTDKMQKCPKWLSIMWKGKMVEIGPKGKIRRKK